MAHGQEILGDDVQVRGRHQVMDVGDAPGDRIFDRDHAELRLAGGDRRERILEGRAGDRLVARISGTAGDVRVRPPLALEHDVLLAHGPSGTRPRGSKSILSYYLNKSRTRSRSSRVFTSSGSASMTVASMRM